ncbi:fanconi-associated nuclease 1 homolog isoform X2 [Oryza brachyantha]|uniref:fanconi-associated nuclease 1 homolog isoform X2 n=1 Tax=Oryza brachyantha TaxID=4533 RepID=UPI001ADCDA83|nr:fanconi-associated nuclease 1 homolog isoform X2 [Oryza brachyantha]
MLRGRESLVRLIGRRRRCSSPLPAALSFGALPPSSPSRSLQVDAGDAEREAAAAGSSSGGLARDGAGAGAEWVACPVCGEPIRGTDYCVNTHLDMCLTRGTKRKLTQSTLLDFSFSKKAAGDPALNNNPETENMELTDGNVSSDGAFFSLNNETVNPKGSANASSPGCLYDSLDTAETCDTCIPPDTFLSYRENTANNGVGKKNLSHIPPTEAFSLGRRFHENIELQEGVSIALSRDPQNAKDPDAIKVLYAGYEREQMLGYLPRELAKVLAPLLDRQYIECKGCVVGVPEQQFDHVPIQLTCQKCKDKNETHDDLKHPQFLWENFIGAVGNGKLQRPSSTRYQTNFSLMITDVMENHSRLFTDKEKSFLDSFQLLSDDGQRLFVRIYTRKGPWFQISSISYREISDLGQAAMELKLAGYIDMISSVNDLSKYNMKEVFDVLSVPEMKEILKELQKTNANCTRRHELLSTLQSLYDSGTCTVLQKRILKWIGTCIRTSDMADELLWRVQRLFFLNGDQDLSSFLLVDLGLVRFPVYACTISNRVFKERSDLLQYEEAIQVAQVMDQSLDNNNMEIVTRCIELSENRLSALPKEENATMAECPPSFFSRFSASWVYPKILTLGVSVYERDRRYTDAIRILKRLLSTVYSDRKRGYWTLRLSVDLEHMNRQNESLSIAEAGVIDPWVRAGPKIALQRRVLRLSKPPRRWKTPSYANAVKRNINEVKIEGRPLNCETGAKNIFYGYDGELCGVEQLALQYYADEGGGWQGTHSEGGIWMTIFGLLMWDVIFSDIVDVFQAKFQTAPLDLETDDFYRSRKDLVESQLKKIQDGMAEEMLISSWELHQGTSCRGVNWDRNSLTDLRAAVVCTGGHRLASLLRHLALDYRSWSSGTPDLLLWRFPDERGGGEAKLVEVKGPRDQLSEQQRAWILVLMDFGFDVEVCKVSPVSKRR